MGRDATDILGRLADRLIEGHLRGTDLRDEAVPGKVGRYTVVRPLGRGAFGRVFLALDPTLGRTVAIKVLARARPADVERFEREIQVLARFEHPGIVRIYDAGVSDEGPFFVMEHVDAPALSESVLPLEESVRVLESVARACHAAHERGIVHRDLKPANVLVGPRPVVVDFGVARVLAEREDGRGSTVGTPEYMAPEQVAGGEVGSWTDVHALGAMLYEALTGHTPFEAGDVPQVLERVRTAVAEPCSRRAPGCPRALERTALRALSKRREDRQGSALVFAEELAAWRARLDLRRSGKLAIALPLAFLLAALVGGGGVLLAHRPPPPPRLRPPPRPGERPLPPPDGEPADDERTPEGRAPDDPLGLGPPRDGERRDDPRRSDDLERRPDPERRGPPRGGPRPDDPDGRGSPREFPPDDPLGLGPAGRRRPEDPPRDRPPPPRDGLPPPPREPR